MKTIPNTDEWESLVSGCKDGDSKAWSQLIRFSLPKVSATVASICKSDRNAIDDIVQETYLRAFLRIEQLRSAKAVVSWLSTIAKNASAEWSRRNPVQMTLDVEVLPAAEGDEYSRRRARLALRYAIEQLPLSQRTVVIDHYYRGYSYKRISQVRMISVEAVRGRLHRAIQMLRDGKIMETDTTEYALSSRDLRLLRRLAEFTVNDARYPAMQGVLIDENGVATATDGRRLLRRQIPGFAGMHAPLLLGPWANTGQLDEALEATLTIDGDRVFVSTADERIALSVLPDVYPETHAIIPTGEVEAILSITADDARRIALLLGAVLEGNRPTTIIEVRGTECVLIPRLEGSVLTASIHISAQYEIEGLIRIGVSTRYLISALQGISEAIAEEIRIELRGPSIPILMRTKTEEKQFALVAPVQIPA